MATRRFMGAARARAAAPGRMGVTELTFTAVMQISRATQAEGAAYLAPVETPVLALELGVHSRLAGIRKIIPLGQQSLHSQQRLGTRLVGGLDFSTEMSLSSGTCLSSAVRLEQTTRSILPTSISLTR